MLIDFFVGVLTAALAGMGVGGGGLLVLYLVFVEKTAQLEAQGINLFFFIFAAISSFFYNRKKRKINYKLCLMLIVCGTAGAVLGAYIAGISRPETIRSVFGWLLIISGVYSFFSDRKKK